MAVNRPTLSAAAAAFAFAALAFAALVVAIVVHGMREDDRRAAVCAGLGGYIEQGTSLCRHRETDAVLATWSELERP